MHITQCALLDITDSLKRKIDYFYTFFTHKTYIKTIWGGRTGFFEPNIEKDVDGKVDMFEMIDKAWQKNEKYKPLFLF